jgi:hypothetical protein
MCFNLIKFLMLLGAELSMSRRRRICQVDFHRFRLHFYRE